MRSTTLRHGPSSCSPYAVAGHLPPYTTEEPQLGVVEGVTTAFLDRYLKHGSLDNIEHAADAPGVATASEGALTWNGSSVI